MMDSGTLHQVMAAVQTGLGMATCMHLMSFASFGVPSMERDENFDITPDQAILVGSLVPMLGIVGNIFAGILVDILGRKNTIILGYFVQISGIALVALAATAEQVLIGRAVIGVACSVIQIPCMIYFSEVSHPDTRDRFGSIIGILATLGSMLPYIMGSYVEWRGLSWVGIVILAPALGIIFSLPQTPMYLFKQGKIADARKSLNWFRSSSTEAAKEFKEIEKAHRESKSSSVDLKLMFKDPFRTPLLVNTSLLVCQQLIGITALMTYISQIIEFFGIEWNSYISSGFTIINLLANVVSSEINVRFNRRPVFFIGTTIAIMLQTFLAFLFWGKDNSAWTQQLLQSYPNLPVVIIFLFLAVFGLSVGPVPYVYIGESFPTKIKGPASALSFTINTFFIGYILQTFRPAVENYGYHFTFLTFACTSALVMFAVYPYMIETKGKSISEIDDIYNKLEREKEKKNN